MPQHSLVVCIYIDMFVYVAVGNLPTIIIFRIQGLLFGETDPWIISVITNTNHHCLLSVQVQRYVSLF